MLVGEWKLNEAAPDRALKEKKHLEGRTLLVIYTISGTELPCHKLWSGESGHVNQISARQGEGLLGPGADTRLTFSLLVVAWCSIKWHYHLTF